MNRSLSPLLCAVLSIIALQSCGGSSVDEGFGGVDTAAADIEFGAAIAAATGAETLPLSVELTGAQALPAVDTRHTGLAEFTVNSDTGQLFGTVTTSLTSTVDGITGVHLHEGGVGEVGAVVVELIEKAGSAGNNVFDVPAGTVLTPRQLTMYQTGQLYVDVHAQSIQLRAQLSEQQIALAPAAELADLQTRVFTPVCSGCHAGSGNNLPSVMSLASAAESYRSLVGVFSLGEPEYLRVDPGDAANSLLIRKVEGTQAVGARMPFRGARLEATTIDALKQWINAGAQP